MSEATRQDAVDQIVLGYSIVALSTRLAHSIQFVGINLKAIADCLKRYCPSTSHAVENNKWAVVDLHHLSVDLKQFVDQLWAWGDCKGREMSVYKCVRQRDLSDHRSLCSSRIAIRLYAAAASPVIPMARKKCWCS